MKIINLTQSSRVYTSNVYLVTGSWNKMEDINTLVDVGMDEAIIKSVNNASTGVGKHKAEQIILTHSHFDHAGMLKKVKAEFHSKALAFTSSLEGVDHILVDGEKVKMGDCEFEVIHMPGHSTDSICLYNKEERVLFAGDSPLIIRAGGGAYLDQFINVLKRISQLPVDTIYFGHGDPLSGNCNELMTESIKHVSKS